MYNGITYKNQDNDNRENSDFNIKFRSEQSLIIENFENAFHDVKAPLQVIITLLNLFENNSSKLSDTSIFSKVRKNCYKILKLITNTNEENNLLGNKVQPKYINTDIVAFVYDIFENTFPLANRKKISTRFYSNLSNKIIAVDSYLTERILMNLLCNSYKFSPCGSEVEVNLYIGNAFMKIEVNDSGDEITDDYIKKMCNRYETIRGPGNKFGQGIGLSVVIDYVNLMDGSVHIHKRMDKKGLSVSVILPVFLAAKEEPQLAINTIDTVQLEAFFE